MKPNDKLLAPEEATKEVIAHWKNQIEKTPGLDPECEYVEILILNEYRRIRTFFLTGFGALNELFYRIPYVLRAAVLTQASGIILLHSKTNGTSEPSQEDIQFTKNLILGGRLLGVDVVDHVVLANGNYTSIRQSGSISNW